MRNRPPASACPSSTTVKSTGGDTCRRSARASASSLVADVSTNWDAGSIRPAAALVAVREKQSRGGGSR
jgi:hypothetical protein